MAGNEIRLRRQIMSAGKMKNYRNYTLLMQRHKRDMMIKQATRFMVYFIIIAILLIVSFAVVHKVKQQEIKNKKMQRSIPARKATANSKIVENASYHKFPDLKSNL
jgi:hypothetical protein